MASGRCWSARRRRSPRRGGHHACGGAWRSRGAGPCGNGFLVNQLGKLTLTGPGPGGLLLLVLAGVFPAAAAGWWRRVAAANTKGAAVQDAGDQGARPSVWLRSASGTLTRSMLAGPRSLGGGGVARGGTIRVPFVRGPGPPAP